MNRFNEEVNTESPKVNLSCFREFEELERCLRYYESLVWKNMMQSMHAVRQGFP